VRAPDKSLLIGDIGGTNARFALANSEQPGFDDAMTLTCADFASADDAIRHYISERSLSAPDGICFAVAGPVIDNTVRLTNSQWTLSGVDLAREFGAEQVRLLNDFEAAAYSIPQLRPADVENIGKKSNIELSPDRFSIAVTGPGTGLGVAGLVRRGSNLVSVAGEGGNVGFAPNSDVQVKLRSELRNKFAFVSAEHLISGPGIENIYWALTEIYGEKFTPLSAGDIFAAGGNGGDPRAGEATQLFFDVLGQVAGDLALTMGAVDGVYLAGGIVKRYPTMLKNSGFRSAFEDKGRYRAYMERIPTLLITHDEPGLLGAAYCALELSLS
jgi:glucokinase